MHTIQSTRHNEVQGQRVSDSVLAERFLAGDQCAFDLLVSRYRRLLANYIQEFLKDDEQISDMLQQVFLQLFLSLPALLTNVPLKGWLMQVARNRCLDELRRRNRHAVVLFSTLEKEFSEDASSFADTLPDPAPLPEELAERVDLRGTLYRAIASLPPKFRAIVLLRCFHQLTFAEIGQRLHMPKATVKTYFHRSLPRLRSVLGPHFTSLS